MSFPRPESHENEMLCPYCRNWIPEDLDGDKRCPNCHKVLRAKCVICGKFFIKREIGTRQVCFNEKCLEVYRYHCGIGDRFWRTEKQKKMDKYNSRGKKDA